MMNGKISIKTEYDSFLLVSFKFRLSKLDHNEVFNVIFLENIISWMKEWCSKNKKENG